MFTSILVRFRRSTGPVRRRRALTLTAVSALAATLFPAVAVTAPARAVTDSDPTFEVTAADLRYILKQIRLSEAHHSDGNLLCASEQDTSGLCVPHPLLPWGLRTVDGRFNNLVEGQQSYGASDQRFPRLLPEHLRDGEVAPLDSPGEGQSTSYAQNGGFVYDSAPRLVSNLIVDQTAANPAAAAQVGADKVPGASLYDHDADPGTPDRVFIPNESPDVGLSAPFNSWMTLFGQFFDHGLDLVDKGGNGTVVVPLHPDDPLYVEGSRTNFMTLTRATEIGTNPDGSAQHNNETTPYVDQNQTYTSHPAHQVFLREYRLVGGRPVATGRLLDGHRELGGMADWADVKAQAAEVLGIELVDTDVHNAPLLVTDFYGNFIPGPARGMPQLVKLDGSLVEGDPAMPVSTTGAKRTGHAFLDDIAHNAAPTNRGRPLTGDADTEVNGVTAPRPTGTYDNELLGAHFITGDGRGNENIGLSAVHHVFHAEHNRLTAQIEDVLDRPENAALRAAYQADPAASDTDALHWDYGQRLFQAAKYVTEMEYQHLVFEDFARKIQPAIDVTPMNESTYHSTIDAAIPAEFAHVVYRFGHSMLTDTIARRGFGTSDVTLFGGFLNPPAFTDQGRLTPDQAAGSIVNGMVAQTGQGIDEFVSDTLRNQLLGLPLDLAAINIARGRDTGVPPLQEARRVFYAQTAAPELKPYATWADFANHLKHRESLVNFIAAYGTHSTVTEQTTVAGKRAAAQALVDANDAFLTAPAAQSGLNDVDFWIGGLAERGMPFGGMLGTTFNHVFETTLENLQNGDRFYYLNRNIGLDLFHGLEHNSFAQLVQRTTDASLLPADVFASQEVFAYDIEEVRAAEEDGRPLPPGLTKTATGTYRYVGEDHIQMHGLRHDATPGRSDDRLRADDGDDALWGYRGRDHIEGGAGNDGILGGADDDVLTDVFGDDTIHGGRGDDAVNAGPGLDLVHGGPGSDFLMHGSDQSEDFAGLGDDFVVGGPAHNIHTGNRGNDWVESLGGSDLVQGDNANGFQNDPDGGHDVLISGPGNDDYDAEGGDDIMFADPGTDRHEGMLGFDWVTHKRDPYPARSDMDNVVLQRPDVQNMRDRFDLVEALSGWTHNDELRGRDHVDMPLPLPPGSNTTGHELTEAHLDMVAGMREMLGGFTAPFIGPNAVSDILIGGEGDDLLEGRSGDDFLDGDRWLDVQLQAPNTATPDTGDTVLVDSLRGLQEEVLAGRIDPGSIEVVRGIVTPTREAGGNDTAVFSEPLADYECSAGDNRLSQCPTEWDGTALTVRYVEPDAAPPHPEAPEPGGALPEAARDDGTDRLVNVERLMFSDSTPPPAPTGVSAQAGNASATVSWIPSAGEVAEHHVQVLVGGEVVDTRVFGEGDDITSAVIDGLTNGTTYTFKVAGANRGGVGDFSEPSNPVTPEPAAPDAPTIAAVQPGDRQAVLTVAPGFDGGAPVSSFTVTVFDATGTSIARITHPATFGARVVVPGLVNGQLYTFQVTATNAAGTSSASPVRSALVGMPPLAPTGLTVAAAESAAVLSWTAPVDDGRGGEVTAYVVRVLRDNGTLVRELMATGTRLRVRLADGQSYRFQVAAESALGVGAFTDASAAFTATGRPAAPALKADSGRPGSPVTASVTWDAPRTDGGARIAGYRVRALRVRADGSVVWSLSRWSEMLPAGRRAHTMPLPPGRYRFVVQAVNAAGWRADSVRSEPVVAR